MIKLQQGEEKTKRSKNAERSEQGGWGSPPIPPQQQKHLARTRAQGTKRSKWT